MSTRRGSLTLRRLRAGLAALMMAAIIGACGGSGPNLTPVDHGATGRSPIPVETESASPAASVAAGPTTAPGPDFNTLAATLATLRRATLAPGALAWT